MYISTSVKTTGKDSIPNSSRYMTILMVLRSVCTDISDGTNQSLFSWSGSL